MIAIELNRDDRKEALEYAIRHFRNEYPTHGFKQEIASIFERMLEEAYA